MVSIHTSEVIEASGVQSIITACVLDMRHANSTTVTRPNKGYWLTEAIRWHWSELDQYNRTNERNTRIGLVRRSWNK